MTLFLRRIGAIFLVAGTVWAQSTDTSPETGEKPYGSYFKNDID